MNDDVIEVSTVHSWTRRKKMLLLASFVSVVLVLITIAGAKIWLENKVDFSNNKNLIVAAVTIILGAGNFELMFGNFNLGGIGTATFAAILLNWLFGLKDKS